MEVQEVEIPKCEPGDVLIKVAYAGICGTDLHAYKGEYSRTKFPVVLGHELSGVVQERRRGLDGELRAGAVPEASSNQPRSVANSARSLMSSFTPVISSMTNIWA